MADAETVGIPAIQYPVERWRTIAIAILLLVGFTLAYMVLSPAPSSQHGDSLYYGYLAETGNMRVFPGNHPLGHVFFNTVFRVAQELGYEGRGLPLFQTANNLIGGMIVSLLFLSSIIVFQNGLLFSAALALVFGVSVSAWKVLGNTADIYSLAFLLALIAWSALVYELHLHKRRLLILSGGVIGLAFLSHQLNGVLVVPALLLIWMEGKNRTRRAVSLLAAAGLTVVLGYVVIWYGIVSVSESRDMLSWIRGPLGEAAWGGYFSWGGFAVALKGATGALVFAGWYSLKFRLVRVLLLIPFGLALLFGFVRLQRAGPWRRHIILAALAEFVARFLLILWFEAFNFKYWALALLPVFVVLAGMGETLEEGWQELSAFLPSRLRPLMPVLLFLPATAIIVFNVYTVALPARRGSDQGDLWAAHSERDDLLFPPWMQVHYLEYWVDRPNTVELDPTYLIPGYGSKAALAALDQRIRDTLCSGHSVLFTPDSFDLYRDEQFARVGSSREEFEDLFGRYSWREIFSYVVNGTTVPVYSLQGSLSCQD